MIGAVTGVAALISLVVTALVGFWAVPFLRKLKFGQSILPEGPQWHMKKQGTPTMGGIMMIIGVAAGIAATFIVIPLIFPDLLSGETTLQKARLWYGLLMAFAMGATGFLDDYIKVVKKRNLGLTSKQKLLLQFVSACIYAIPVYLAGDHGMDIPFIGTWELGVWYIPIMIFIIVAVANAVNLTDGLDGLASTVTFVFAIAFLIIAGLLNMMGIAASAAAIAGACVGFLFWNFYPAKVFMGDTGSLFLGGMASALIFGVNMPFLFLLAGVIYLIETLSVIIQVTYFKITHGKRIFKMSPLHHHFEMCGWSEIKVDIVFALVTVVGSALAIAAVYFGWLK